ncbi:twin-arginine translocase subunit TatC [Desulfolutivibrio sp.]|uniref:twin-arginine translocase subunit TatC n=1 Tax=Desulfolutivibrio sp. TaxID=2773296 RepID=UPI002F966C81
MDEKKDGRPSSEGETGVRQVTLLEHLTELRNRLLRCFAAIGVGFFISYAFAERLLGILLEPLARVLPEGTGLIALTLPEKFFTVMKLAFVCGIFVASPYIFYQLWRFVGPGLYRDERRMVIPAALASAIFFACGALFGYYVVFPFGFKFFVDYASDLVTIMPTVGDYFSLAVTLLLAFGLIFNLPVAIFFLARMGVVTNASLRKFRRWAVLLAFIAAAILTPTPDAVNQLLMAGPIIILYEVGIWVAYFVGKKKKKAEETLPTPTDTPPDGPKPPDEAKPQEEAPGA